MAYFFYHNYRKIGDLVSEEIVCDKNLFAEMIGIIKEFYEIDEHKEFNFSLETFHSPFHWARAKRGVKHHVTH